MGKLSYGSTGISYQPKKVELNVGGAPKCPRCGDRVYFNEEKKALGKSWHTRCFSCASCKKSLDSANCSTHEGEVYCARCHRKEFGPKGYGFAGGMAGLSTESTYNNVRPVSPLNTHTVPKHIKSQSIDRDDPESCPRCGKRVYFAEEVKALRRKWHRLCFKCGHCSTILEPSRCNEHESEVYCRNCYGRMYGPSGYGFAGGVGTLMSSDTSKPFTNRTNIRESSPVVTKTEMRSAIAGSHEWTEGTPIMANGLSRPGSQEWTEGVPMTNGYARSSMVGRQEWSDGAPMTNGHVISSITGNQERSDGVPVTNGHALSALFGQERSEGVSMTNGYMQPNMGGSREWTEGVPMTNGHVASMTGSHEWTEGGPSPVMTAGHVRTTSRPMAGTHEWTDGVII